MLSKAMKTLIASKATPGQVDSRRSAVLVAAAFLATVPLETTHLLFMLVGAVGYMLFISAAQAQAPARRNKQDKIKKVAPSVDTDSSIAKIARICSGARAGPECDRVSGAGSGWSQIPRDSRPEQAGNVRQRHAYCTVRPVDAPTFKGVGWDAQVEELVERLLPTQQCDAAVSHLARTIQRAIRPLFPQAEVVAFTSANLMAGKAFGVAVPDVEVVINISPDAIFSRSAQQRHGHKEMDMQKVHKHVLRKCTERLVSTSGFKFRRSAFRGCEPKVTVLAPVTLRIFSEAFPVDLCVNSVTPFHCATILTECGQLDPRAKALALLIRRWAKDRGISHSARGHLSPYLWTLLVIYFLQVWNEGDGPLLPPLEGFHASAALVPKASDAQEQRPRTVAAVRPTREKTSSLGKLFKEFLHFYTASFDWTDEAICVRRGFRAPPDAALRSDNREWPAPFIEDPFRNGHNLGVSTTAAGLERMHKEMQRAYDISHKEESLTVMLEPWSPSPEDSPAEAETEPFPDAS